MKLIKDNFDLFCGGMASVIALLITIIKFCYSGRGISELLNFLQEFSGLFVSVLVFFVAAKSILRQMKRRETFASVLKEELDLWAERNAPLITRDGKYQKSEEESNNCYYMLTDHDHIFDVGDDFGDLKAQRGRFVELPERYEKENRIIFYLNGGMFADRAKANGTKAWDEMGVLMHRIANCISAKFGKDTFEASGRSIGVIRQVTVRIKRDLNTPEDARAIVKLLDYVMILYLAAA